MAMAPIGAGMAASTLSFNFVQSTKNSVRALARSPVFSSQSKSSSQPVRKTSLPASAPPLTKTYLKEDNNTQGAEDSSNEDANLGDSAFQGDYQIQTYIEMIRQFSRDKKGLEERLTQLKDFASGKWMQTSSSGAGDNNVSASAEAEASSFTQIRVEGDIQQLDAQGAELEVVHQEDGSILIREKAQVQQADPLILDLDGNGIDVTLQQDGANFDINGDGLAERTSFVSGSDAFLALDRNQNGQIDGGQELFGDQQGATDGFAELRKFDSNGDEMIDSRDGIYSSLLLFSDHNGDGVSQANELRTLAQEQIVSIQLDSQATQQVLNGNTLFALSAYRRQDGTAGQIGDVLLNFIG